jgi:hypothetical protein
MNGSIRAARPETACLRVDMHERDARRLREVTPGVSLEGARHGLRPDRCRRATGERTERAFGIEADPDAHQQIALEADEARVHRLVRRPGLARGGAFEGVRGPRVPDSTALRIMSVNTKADRLLALGLERDPLRRAESRCVGHTRRGGGD